MVTLIILTAVVICLLALLIAILYMRNEEVQVTDKATDSGRHIAYTDHHPGCNHQWER